MTVCGGSIFVIANVTYRKVYPSRAISADLPALTKEVLMPHT